VKGGGIKRILSNKERKRGKWNNKIREIRKVVINMQSALL